MKRRRLLITILIVLAIVALAIVERTCVHVVPLRQCSQPYQHYHHVEGIKATFVKDYRIDDTTFVDVTLLQAKTDSAWHLLQKDFNIPQPIDEDQALFDSTTTVQLWFAPKNDHSAPMDSDPLKNDIIAASRHTQSLCIFHLSKFEQITRIINLKIKEITN